MLCGQTSSLPTCEVCANKSAKEAQDCACKSESREKDVIEVRETVVMVKIQIV